jgi:hypothetical protein
MQAAHNPLTNPFKLFFHCKIKPRKIGLHTIHKESLPFETKHDDSRHMQTSPECSKSEVPHDQQNTRGYREIYTKYCVFGMNFSMPSSVLSIVKQFGF